MKRVFQFFLPLLCFGLVSTLANAQAVDASKVTNDDYQAALQAYLAGDFDQAILLDAKALQVNSQDKKAEALLNILVSEKDTANKTVIWIGGKPSVVEANNQSPELQLPVTVVKERVIRPGGADSKKMAELETRVQTVAFLMERDSFNQYRELNNNQTQMEKELEKISVGFRYTNWFFLLALVIACLALWKSWKNGEDFKKQKENLGQDSPTQGRSRVVNIRRM